MKKYLIILLAIFIASPLSSLISNYFIYFRMPVTVREDYYEYWSFWGNVMTVAIFQLLIYILVGIPVTLLIDRVIKHTKLNNIGRSYLLQLFLYGLSALVLGLYLFTSSKNVESLMVVFIDVFTYFHILLLLRTRSKLVNLLFYNKNKKRGLEIYKLFLYVSLFTMLYSIIWLGVESIQIKIVLGIIGLTFIPKVRRRLYHAPLVIRKSKVALYTSLCFTFLIFIFDIKTSMTEPNLGFNDFSFIILIFFSSLLGSFIYGLPVSLFSDFITLNVKKYRLHLSFLVHIGFGLFTFFFLGPLMILATFFASLFFLIDKIVEKREHVHFGI
ncbi:hypothetical protein [Mesobacillus subterraneus]|uniref:hypothetical protein n=1 Tax=Mesobacillus subterraneus TaxID=285983 RepID=UPI001CFF2C24|nr:hypothetical protein [Mesobacillus subterraneus]